MKTKEKQVKIKDQFETNKFLEWNPVKPSETKSNKNPPKIVKTKKNTSENQMNQVRGASRWAPLAGESVNDESNPTKTRCNPMGSGRSDGRVGLMDASDRWCIRTAYVCLFDLHIWFASMGRTLRRPRGRRVTRPVDYGRVIALFNAIRTVVVKTSKHSKKKQHNMQIRCGPFAYTASLIWAPTSAASPRIPSRVNERPRILKPGKKKKTR